MDLSLRVAELADVPRLEAVMDLAIAELQRDFLTPEQIESSRAIMGVDTALVADGTYFVVESGPDVAGCGGWSRRATLYGSDSTPGRDVALLDPATDPARVRAMYTHPAFARRWLGFFHGRPAAAPPGSGDPGRDPPALRQGARPLPARVG